MVMFGACGCMEINDAPQTYSYCLLYSISSFSSFFYICRSLSLSFSLRLSIYLLGALAFRSNKRISSQFSNRSCSVWFSCDWCTKRKKHWTVLGHLPPTRIVKKGRRWNSVSIIVQFICYARVLIYDFWAVVTFHIIILINTTVNSQYFDHNLIDQKMVVYFIMQYRHKLWHFGGKKRTAIDKVTGRMEKISSATERKCGRGKR